MAMQLTSANKQQALIAAEKDQLQAAIDWSSAESRSRSERLLRSKVELLDRAERERDKAVTKLKAAESRAVLASKRATLHEEEKAKYKAQLDEMAGEAGFTRDDYVK